VVAEPGNRLPASAGAAGGPVGSGARAGLRVDSLLPGYSGQPTALRSPVRVPLSRRAKPAGKTDNYTQNSAPAPPRLLLVQAAPVVGWARLGAPQQPTTPAADAGCCELTGRYTHARIERPKRRETKRQATAPMP
jgi:hypothetical protein